MTARTGTAIKVVFTDIEWDADGADCDLPREVTLDVSSVTEADLSIEGANILSDKFGCCVIGFSYRTLPRISHYYSGGQVAVFDPKSSTYDLYQDETCDEYLGNVDSISAAEF